MIIAAFDWPQTFLYLRCFEKGKFATKCKPEGITVREKILEGENFGEFGEQLAIRQNFPHQYL